MQFYVVLILASCLGNILIQRQVTWMKEAKEASGPQPGKQDPVSFDTRSDKVLPTCLSLPIVVNEQEGRTEVG